MKNAIVYRLHSPLPDADALAECLEESPARRCQFNEESHIGFRPPIPGTSYALEQDGLTMFMAEVTKVVLPAKVVKRETERKLDEVSAKYGRELSDSEKQHIKEAVRSRLIARSHQVSNLVEIRHDRQRSLLALDVSSTKKADEVLNKLREVLGSLRVVPFVTQEGAAAAMTRWLAQGRPDPAHWYFDGSCRLASASDDVSHIIFDKCQLVHEISDLESPEELESLGPMPEVAACLDQGRLCTEARFLIDEVGEFVMTHNLTLKSMKVIGDVPEPETDDPDEAKRLNYEGSALLTWGMIGKVVDDLQRYLGEASIEEEDLEAGGEVDDPLPEPDTADALPMAAVARQEVGPVRHDEPMLNSASGGESDKTYASS